MKAEKERVQQVDPRKQVPPHSAVFCIHPFHPVPRATKAQVMYVNGLRKVYGNFITGEVQHEHHASFNSVQQHDIYHSLSFNNIHHHS